MRIRLLNPHLEPAQQRLVPVEHPVDDPDAADPLGFLQNGKPRLTAYAVFFEASPNGRLRLILRP